MPSSSVIDGARAELVDRGIDVSDVVRRVRNEGRLAGPDPERRS
jgi:hypothetical protein